MPPREVGEALPDELNSLDPTELETTENDLIESSSFEETHDPVQRAIAKYLGIDLSPEGRAALHRRGICVIVWGGPYSGKTTIARQISNNY